MPEASTPGGRPLAAALNRACECFAVSREGLIEALRVTQPPELAPLADHHAHLVAGSPVFVGTADILAIARFTQDLAEITALPAFQKAALQQAGAPAQHDPGIAGGLLGLDFHLTSQGPRLIEINTNPGGVLINAGIQGALQACCADAGRWLPALPQPREIQEAVFSIFEREWRQSGGSGVPTVAIVDEAPESQYLYPEFRLFRALFESRGWRALIADPAALKHRAERLWLGDTAVDLVYNRLTDFSLDATSSAALRSAYLAGDVVLTPHPRAHALHADKRLLVWLSNTEKLQELGADAALAARVSAMVPATFRVQAAEAERWWTRRSDFYFKPARGYGGKAAYAGAKLTRRVWEQVLAGDYLAQQAVAPPQRGRNPDAALKYDLRAYVDGGRVVLHAARLYRGQTTNFRTEGGGFAPVAIVEMGGAWTSACAGAASSTPVRHPKAGQHDQRDRSS